ncbi:MAG: cupin domain-containing protein [Candidatus Obscuribacterales bacterium]|nr:cupin domain-containing protein [Candidatus Obscuribacterales bacterium]
MCNQTIVPAISPKLGFHDPEFYGAGISVKEIDFEAKGSTPPFKSTYFEVLPGFTTPVDQHKVEECWIVLKGSGILVCDGQEIPLAEQDIVHFASFEGHSVQNNSDQPLLLCSIYW